MGPRLVIVCVAVFPFPPYMAAMTVSRNGSLAISSGPGSLLRLDFGAPGSVAPTYGGPLYYSCNGGFTAVQLTLDDALVVRADASGVTRLDPVTLATTGSLSLPGPGIQSSAIR